MGKNIPDHIFESSETIFGVATDADPGSRIFLTLYVYPGTGFNIPDLLGKDFLLFHIVDKIFFHSHYRVTGGMKVKADRDEASPYAAMLAAQDVAEKVKVSTFVDS
jgi:hypothetical protein